MAINCYCIKFKRINFKIHNMSFKYTIHQYYFQSPDIITEDLYNSLKYKLQNDKSFSLVDKKDTVFREFRKAIIFGILTIPVMLLGLIVLLTLIPSMINYSKYLKQKHAYFQVMEYYIKTSESDHDFLKKFYKMK